VVISVPFFCSGLALALLFTRGARQVNRLYAFDLFGAGLGCVALAVVMPVCGGSGSVIMAAALGLLAAVIFGLRPARWFACSRGTPRTPEQTRSAPPPDVHGVDPLPPHRRYRAAAVARDGGTQRPPLRLRRWH